MSRAMSAATHKRTFHREPSKVAKALARHAFDVPVLEVLDYDEAEVREIRNDLARYAVAH